MDLSFLFFPAEQVDWSNIGSVGSLFKSKLCRLYFFTVLLQIVQERGSSGNLLTYNILPELLCKSLSGTRTVLFPRQGGLRHSFCRKNGNIVFNHSIANPMRGACNWKIISSISRSLFFVVRFFCYPKSPFQSSLTNVRFSSCVFHRNQISLIALVSLLYYYFFFAVSFFSSSAVSSLGRRP